MTEQMDIVQENPAAPDPVVPAMASAGVTNSLRAIWAIAMYTLREGLRKKTLIGFLILSILVIFGTSFITAFLNQKTIGDATQDIEIKLIKDICVTTISIFGVLITIFTSASVVPGEVENRVIYTVLSKPLRRFQYLLGKFIGAQFIILLNLALMGGLFFLVLWVKQGVPATLLLWSLLLTYFEFLIVSAFTFAISCTATSAVLPTIGGLFIYITGNMTEYLRDVSNRAGQTTLLIDQWIGNIALWLSRILPNLTDFSLKNQILHLQPNDLPRDVQIPNLIAYSLMYVIAGYCIAYWIFRRKEF
ncbi:MAG TPA: ABC transporter permease [Candidatus Hydrogenedentes bacterium]|nr:ABC transporter permease [Candidatus Hydrogenedentota bacterium]HOS04094.1 ABC transporter permease [Candidatus Hydrogenedentota bacterium]